MYNLTINTDENQTSFKLSLQNLNETYIKHFKTTKEDILTYNEIALSGNSFGAYFNNELVGIAICEEQQWNNSLYILNFLTAQKMRQKGVGKSLMKKIILHAKNKENRIIELETQNTNVPAIKFYQKQGFKITGLKSNIYNEEPCEKAIYMTFEL